MIFFHCCFEICSHKSPGFALVGKKHVTCQHIAAAGRKINVIQQRRTVDGHNLLDSKGCWCDSQGAEWRLVEAVGDDIAVKDLLGVFIEDGYKVARLFSFLDDTVIFFGKRLQKIIKCRFIHKIDAVGAEICQFLGSEGNIFLFVAAVEVLAVRKNNHELLIFLGQIGDDALPSHHGIVKICARGNALGHSGLEEAV